MPKQQGNHVLQSIAANVRRLRVRQKLTQAQLAEMAELELRQLQRIERAEINFGVVTLVRLAEALEVRPSALLQSAELAPVRRGRPPSRRHPPQSSALLRRCDPLQGRRAQPERRIP